MAPRYYVEDSYDAQLTGMALVCCIIVVIIIAIVALMMAPISILFVAIIAF